MQTKTNSVESSSQDKTTSAPTAKKAAPSPEGQFDLFAAPGTGSVSEAEVASGFKSIKNTNHFYQHIDSPLSRKLLLKKTNATNFGVF